MRDMRDMRDMHSVRVMHELHQVHPLRSTRAVLTSRSLQAEHDVLTTLSMRRQHVPRALHTMHT